jgi:hypothetical protein
MPFIGVHKMRCRSHTHFKDICLACSLLKLEITVLCCMNINMDRPFVVVSVVQFRQYSTIFLNEVTKHIEAEAPAGYLCRQG